jgi:Flp pilus assembly protein TadD
MGIKFGSCGLLALMVPLAACDIGSGTKHRAAHVPEPQLMDERAAMSEEGALKLARSLRESGAQGDAFSVLASAHARFPDSQAILSAYGRQAALMGNDEVATRLLARAIAAHREDWRALSAYAVVAGRQGRDEDARQAFAQARAVSGANTASLNNLGMFYLLEGRAADAAEIFRQALIAPNLDKAHVLLVKRNLAVALAVEGDFETADRLAGFALPRELENAGAREIAAFMGVNRPSIAENSGWTPRLAASPVISNFAR